MSLSDLEKEEILTFSHIDNGIPSNKVKDGLILRKVA